MKKLIVAFCSLFLVSCIIIFKSDDAQVHQLDRTRNSDDDKTSAGVGVAASLEGDIGNENRKDKFKSKKQADTLNLKKKKK